MGRTGKVMFSALALSASVLLAQGSPANEIAPSSTGQTAVADDMALGQSLSNDYLDATTGRQDMNVDQLEMQVSTASQYGRADNNSIVKSAVTSGANGISGNAFSQASGLVTVIQNSGNQVLIQNDLIMNLTVK